MRRLLTIIFIISGIALFGQVDNKAKDILDRVSATTKAYKSITANFNFIMQNNEANINETKKGTIIIQKDKYLLTISGVEIYNDGITQWTYMPDASEVNITSAENDDPNALNPATLFTIYEKGYSFNYLGSATQNNVPIHKIELIPTEVRDFSKVVLDINKTNNQILSAIMFGKDGNRYSIVVTSFIPDKSYPESNFKFDKNQYPGVDIVDMR